MEKIINFDFKNKHKKIWFIVIITILLFVFLISSIIYVKNKSARNFIDKYIFRKNVSEEKVPFIDIDYASNTNVIPYGKYICILAEHNLTLYGSNGKKEHDIKVEINNPIYDVNGKYLLIGEKNSQKIYLVSGNKIVWEKDVEGKITRVKVNKNGYSSIIISDTTYKSEIINYDENGDKLFKTYLSSTLAIDAEISPDNNYFAYAETNTSGSLIQSNVKILSIKEVKEKNTEPEYTYSIPNNSLIMKLAYQDKNKLICIYDDSIHLIDSNTDIKLFDLIENDKKINFGGIDLKNFIYRSVEYSTGFFSADTKIEILNINNQKENVYTIEGVVKDIKTNNNIIAINLGSEVDFINTNGWLVKRYISTQEVRNIILCDTMAGIVYRDKIELINL